MRSNFSGMKISGLEITRNKTTCRQVTTSMQLQNRSYQVLYWKRTAAKCAKLKNARATRAKLLVFIVKYVHLWRSRLPSRPGLLKLLVVISTWATIEIWKFPHQTVRHHGPQLTFRRTSKPKGNYATDSRSSDLCLASNLWHLSPCSCPNAFSPFFILLFLHFEVGQELSK